jgi:hypothetical protein
MRQGPRDNRWSTRAYSRVGGEHAARGPASSSVLTIRQLPRPTLAIGSKLCASRAPRERSRVAAILTAACARAGAGPVEGRAEVGVATRVARPKKPRAIDRLDPAGRTRGCHTVRTRDRSSRGTRGVRLRLTGHPTRVGATRVAVALACARTRAIDPHLAGRAAPIDPVRPAVADSPCAAFTAHEPAPGPRTADGGRGFRAAGLPPKSAVFNERSAV